MTLTRRPLPSHDWPEDAPPGTCLTDGCSAEWDERGRPPFGCVRQSSLDSSPFECGDSSLSRSKGLNRVSDRRTEKRKARGVRGPLQDYVRRRTCEVPGCQLQGEPAHYRTVNAGHGDWKQVGDPETGVRWVGRIGPLCPGHHRKYDGEVGGGSGEHFERRHGIDFEQICAEWGGRFAERHELDLTAREHPYEQIGWSHG